MTNRRSFLKMLFGGLTAAVAVPAVEKWIPAGASIPVRFDAHAFMLRQPFDLVGLRSVLLRVPPCSALSALSIRFDDDCQYEGVIDTLNNLAVELLVKDRIYFEGPVSSMVTSELFQEGPRHRFYSPVLMDRDLCVNFGGHQDWKPPAGVHGEILVDGLYLPQPF